MPNSSADNSPTDSGDEHSTGLPVVSCTNCGVCCFHMGYPAFILPVEPMTEAEIDADPKLRELAKNPTRKKRMLDGHPGEPLWHELPANLKQELEAHMAAYVKPDYDGTLETLDGPCIWLDMETRMCKNHLHRPNVCRDFDTGSKACLDWRKVYQDRIG